IIKRHSVWCLMSFVKSTRSRHAVQVTCPGARNHGQCYLRYTALERAGMLKDKATRATANATGYSLQTQEAGRAGSTVHHQVFHLTLTLYVSLVRLDYSGPRELRCPFYFVIGFFVP